VTVTPLVPVPASDDVPDAPIAAGPSARAQDFGGALLRALDGAGAALARADAAEKSFARGGGGLQEMVVERAQADIALAIAGAAASRTAQALSTILGMQV
jgi:flagellar hook-basal body complex protein FliE